MFQYANLDGSADIKESLVHFDYRKLIFRQIQKNIVISRHKQNHCFSLESFKVLTTKILNKVNSIKKEKKRKK